MIEQLINDILNEHPLSIERIEEGISNLDYLVTLKDRKVVLRIPYVSNQDIMDYTLEKRCLDLIKPYDLDVPLLYYDPKTGIKISLYIDNLLTFNQTNSVSEVIKVAKMLRSFHELPIILNEAFDIIELFNKFKQKTLNPRYTFDFEEEILNQLPHYQQITTLCHNDLVGGNLCFTKDRSYLIDFEYAKDNDPYFDVASFITENDIQDAPRRNAFITHYFEHKAFDLQKFEYYEKLLYLFWCQWSMMNETLNPDPVFTQITDLKAKRLLEYVSHSKA